MAIEDNQGRNMVPIGVKISRYLQFWPFFLLSILVCLCLGYFFNRSGIPMYTVYAKILITGENTGQDLKQEKDKLANDKKAEDEIEILKSRTIMEQVVNDLQLGTRYYSIDELKLTDLYSNSPIKLNLIHATQAIGGQYFDIVIKDKDTFILKQAHSVSTFEFGKKLKSDVGIWKLEPTNKLLDYVGQTIRITLDDPQQVTDGILSAFNAYLTTDESSIVELAIKETVPERGADVINRAIKVYNLASIDYKNKINRSTLKFLDDRLDSITSELNLVEKRVENYKSSRGITDLSSESSKYLENVKVTDSKLNELDVQLLVLNTIEKYINSPGNGGKVPSTTGISDPALMSMVDQLLKLESQKDRLLANTPERNPIFIPINREISSTKVAIRENIKGIRGALLATRNQFKMYNSGFESSIKKLPGQEREFITIKRQQSIKEELYMYLLQKREEAGVNNASKLLDSRIIDQAHYGAPETHNANLTYALAFIFGLIFPAGVLFAKDALNNRITHVFEIEDAVYAPVLGELSYEKSQPVISILDGSRSMFSEQFRILRTKLHHLNGKSEGGKITLLTSGMPGEGKSMISRNLGAVMAAAGRRTVIVDVDLRKPQLAKAFNLSNDIGLSNYLAGQTSMEAIIQPSLVHPQLFIISSGSDINNPSELLENIAIEDLFKWLRLNFDEIILDTPPIQLVADALILTKFCDTTLYVLRQDFTLKSQFKFINQLSTDENIKNMHIIFNGVSTGMGYGYNNKYASHYYIKDKPESRFSLLRKN
ncbi:MAG: capsular biosynthesis protein [Pedobacter sp.]|jgi:tyrosine-protein kinase Etk/Wzc|nr:capsular biosynthesis protein [Pedobacter sp.]